MITWDFKEVMRAILANLTAAAMFIHASLGCCWHHDHTRAAAGSIGPAHAEHDHPDAVESRVAVHEDCPHDSDREGAPQRHQCDESPCVFMRVNAPDHDLSPQLAVLDGFCIDELAPIAVAQQNLLSWMPAISPAARLPMRLHLFQGLLLI
jgi:hypothetical protein